MVGNLTPRYGETYRLVNAAVPSRGQAMVRDTGTYWDGGKVCATENSAAHLGAYDDEKSDAGQLSELALVAGRTFTPVVGGRFYAALSATVAVGDSGVTADDGGYKNDSGITSPNVVCTFLEAGDSGDVVLAEYGSQSDQHD